MKLNIERSGHTVEAAHTPSFALGPLSFARARDQLRQAVGGVLSGSLEALGERVQAGALLASLADASYSAKATTYNAYRLREVLERDRALAAAQPPERASDSDRDALAAPR